MLTHIHIWNFAIVEALDIEFEQGLTVMTGETGAGKSILLDALGLALGDRADNSVIRHGADKAEISVTFSTHANPDAEQWLRAHELDSEQECIIRRTISSNGPSRAFINGKPAPITSLRELGELLVDLHGQHEHQSLLKKDSQRQLLDDYAHHDELLTAVENAYRSWAQKQKEFDQLSKAQSDRDSRLDLLRFQVNELEALDLRPGEAAELDHEHKRLSHASELLQTSEQIVQALEEDEQAAINQQLHHFLTDLRKMLSKDEALKPIAELIEGASIQLDEASSELRHYIDSMELDPARLSQVEERIASLHGLSRKHRVEAEELVSLLPQMQEELANLEQADIKLDQLQKQINQAAETYQQHAAQLSKSRYRAASALAEKVTDAMQELGMEGGRFEVALENRVEAGFNPLGMETIEFLVSANPGQPTKPLSKVASGGELSRISLAIQVITAKASRIPTLVFDEVDVGIGGRVAEIVGRQLRTLGEQRQVISVTHLPQVAALGHHHLQVSKQSDGESTNSQIIELGSEQRVDEIARMLGGIEITAQTRSHAEEMLSRAND